MSTQTVEQICFDFLPRLPIVVEPTDTRISGNVGILPIRQFDDQIGFSQRFIACLEDPRDPDQIEHTFAEMTRQRLYGILAGYEDCNDHDALRADPVFKLVGGRTPEDDDLASQLTLSRFENAIDISSLWRLHDFLIDDFIRSFARPPLSLTIDLDAVDDPCHCQQQLALFHGFYEQYQYLPIVISCAETQQVLWSAVRPGNVHAALNLLIRLRTKVSDPPTLLAHDDPTWAGLAPEERVNYVPVEDPTLSVAALAEPERRLYQNRRRRKDPLGQGHIATWRLMLIKVAGEVIQTTRRIRIRISAHSPYLHWFQEVCRRLYPLSSDTCLQT